MPQELVKMRGNVIVYLCYSLHGHLGGIDPGT